MRAIEIDRLLGLVGTIYEMALDAGAMPRVLKNVASALEADAAHLCSMDNTTGAIVASTVSQDPDCGAHDAHLAYRAVLHPTRTKIEQVPSDTVMPCHEHFNERHIARSGVFQTFTISAGQRWNMGTHYDCNDGTSVSISVSRPVGASAFEDDAVQKFLCIVPHLRSALVLQRRWALHVAADLNAHGLLAALPIGGMLLDTRGCLIEANAASSEAIAELSVGSGSFLRFHAPEQQLAWLQAIRCVGIEHLPRMLTLAAQTGNRWRLHLIPLQRISEAHETACSQLILAAFERVHATTEQKLATLRGRYPLTKAEAEVLTRLLDGLSAKQIARQRDASVNTIRTHLKSILSKTGCCSQRELILRLHEQTYPRHEPQHESHMQSPASRSPSALRMSSMRQ